MAFSPPKCCESSNQESNNSDTSHLHSQYFLSKELLHVLSHHKYSTPAAKQKAPQTGKAAISKIVIVVWCNIFSLATTLIKSTHLKCGYKELENEMMLVTSLKRKGNGANFPLQAHKKGIKNMLKQILALVVPLLRVSTNKYQLLISKN